MNARTQTRRSVINSCLAALLALVTTNLALADDGPESEFPELAQGGLVVQVGCADADRLVSLAGENRLVQGVDRSGESVESARTAIRAAELYGKVSAVRRIGPSLPYTDGLVNLLIVESSGEVSFDEQIRVLAPRGVVYTQTAEGWTRREKPVPDDIDQWTHYLYDASNNAVGADERVGPPKYHQWIAGPRWARSHDHLSTTSAVVSSGGRIFYIIDEGLTASVALLPRWKLISRDAHSGVLLWKRPIELWEGHLRDFRSGPSDLARRLVAVGDRVYVTLGYGEPISVLDARTGESLETYESTRGTLEMIVEGGTLYAVVGDRVPETIDTKEHIKNREGIWHWWPIYDIDLPERHLEAIDTTTGKTLWTKRDDLAAEILPATIASAGGSVYFQNYGELIKLDAKTGAVQWQIERPVSRQRPAWSTPTVVVHGDVVISADRSETAKAPRTQPSDKPTQWVINSQGGIAPPGRMIAVATETGERLWESPCKECYNAPVDILIADGLVWSGNLVGAREPGIVQGLDLHTGEVRRTRTADQEHFRIIMGHHRCYRNKATAKYLVLGRDGVELIDIKTGKGYGHNWTRGACQYGVMPCNGLIYVPPHSCACHVETKLNSFLALAASRETPEQSPRFVKGPAYGETADGGSTDATDWPTYRHDAGRTGCASTELPTKLTQAWSTKLPDTAVKGAVVAAGRVFVAGHDSHAIYALDASTGETLWHFTADGPIDSPPTIHDGAAIFGCSDGWIYAVRVTDGALAWRFRAAPSDRRIVVYGRIESPCPVHGSVLVRDGIVYAVSGRTSQLDDGMKLLKIEASTGKLILEKPIPAGLSDILLAQGDDLFLRHKRMDLEGDPLPANVPHLYSPAGLLDDDWWHRTYWQVGMRMGSGWGSWSKTGTTAPVGRIIVHDGETIYGFRRSRYHRDGSHVGMGPMHYLLCARSWPKKPGAAETIWTTRIALLARAMVLAGDRLFVAGPPDLFVQVSVDGKHPYTYASDEDLEKQEAAFAGKKGGVLQVLSTANGTPLARYELDSPPNWDSMVAAAGQLFLTTMDGRVICMKGE